MWVQAGFSPDTFWVQTPRHFQLSMQGVRKRLTSEMDMHTRQAWQSGNFAGLASVGKLKDLKHYLGASPSRRQTPQEMLTVFKTLQAGGAAMTIRKLQ